VTKSSMPCLFWFSSRVVAESHRKKQILRCAQDDGGRLWRDFATWRDSLRPAMEADPSLRFGMTRFWRRRLRTILRRLKFRYD